MSTILSSSLLLRRGCSMQLTEVIKQFLMDCEIRSLSEQTIIWYNKRLTRFIKELEQVCSVVDLEQVRVAHLRQVVLHLMGSKSGESGSALLEEKGLSVFTVRGYVRAVKVFFGWCVDEELLTSDPSVRLVQPKAPEYVIPAFTV